MDDVVDVLVRRLDPELPLPSWQHPGDAGLDLRTTEAAVIGPGSRALLGTGIAIALPTGCVGFVVPRSGLAVRHGVTLLNSPGTIDAGFRGEVRVIVANTDPEAEVRIERGDRVGQLIVQRLPPVRLHEVERLPGSDRGDGGFGSTGR